MQTFIKSHDFSLTTALDTFIRQQVRQFIGPHSHRVEKLVVRIKDINGPKGGDDKECIVEVQVKKMPTIIVSKRSPNTYASIHRALARASRVTLRHAGKKRTKLRKQPTKKEETFELTL